MKELRLVPWSVSTVTHRERRGARVARREERAYRGYATDEQRSQAGCIGVRMPPYLRIRALAFRIAGYGLPQQGGDVEDQGHPAVTQDRGAGDAWQVPE
jgi:hypothetical protein